MNFQPVIKWSGSKRVQSEQIVGHFSKEIKTYYEPFCGSCSVMFQLLNNSNIHVDKYVCSDLSEDIIEFFNNVKYNHVQLSEEYRNRWNEMFKKETVKEKQEYYNEIRTRYNEEKELRSLNTVYDFMFLSRTCINGLIRYNSKGKFNSPYHLNRNGINPDKMEKIIFQWSDVINKHNVEFKHCSYDTITPENDDFMFLDPPYANTKGMYEGGISVDKFFSYLRNLKCSYAFSFDGKRSKVDMTYEVPKDVYDKHIYLDKCISGFKKLHAEVDYVQESLYIKKKEVEK